MLLMKYVLVLEVSCFPFFLIDRCRRTNVDPSPDHHHRNRTRHHPQFSCATLTLGTVGALCDYVGRKPAMIMTTCGQVRVEAGRVGWGKDFGRTGEIQSRTDRRCAPLSWF